jgi:hypothetical protein
VAKYATQIKPSARRELENLSDHLIARLIPKIERLAVDRIINAECPSRRASMPNCEIDRFPN